MAYDFEALSPNYTNEQRSQLRCVSPGGESEESVATNPNWGSGVWSYSRTGLTIANGVTGGGDVEFELHAGIDNLAAIACGTDFHKVNDGTWTITVYYLDPNAPLAASNPMPADSAEDISIAAATLTWDFGDNTDSYDLYFGTDNPPTTKVAEDIATGGASAGSYDYAELMGSSTYFWQVVAKNDFPLETPGPVWRFSTECTPASVPITENFDSYTFPSWNGPEGYHGLTPLCWGNLFSNVNTYANNGYFNQQFSSYSSPNVWMASNEGDGDAWAMMVTPELAEDISTLQLTFYAKSNGGNTLHIGTMSDPEDESTFTEFTSVSTANAFVEYEVPFITYTGTDTYIALRYEASGPWTYEYVYVDDVSIDVAPTCPKPKDLYASSITSSSAELGWLEQGAAAEWNIEYGLAGFIPDEVADITTTENPYTLEGLDPNTEYDFYVQSNCGGGDLSVWNGPYTFATACESLALPIYENFDASMEIPNCWNVAATSGTWWQISTSNYYSDPNCFLFYINTTLDNIALVSPMPDVTSLSELMVTFYAKHSWQDGKEIVVGTMSNPLDIATFNPIETVVTSSEMEEYEVWFNTYTGTDMYIAIAPGQNETYQYMYIDDITIDYLPTCLNPVDLFVDEIGQNEATLNWTESGTAEMWEIEVGYPGFTPGTGTAVQQYVFDPGAPPAEYSYVMDGLESGTYYDAFIRADCGGGDLSDWSDPVQFLTELDYFMTLPVIEDYEDGFDITGNIPTNLVDWTLNTDLYNNGMQSVHNAYGSDNENTLLIYGKLNLAIYPKVSLSFAHIAKVEGDNDECYVEISTDGGVTFEPFPDTTYFGVGNYFVPQYGNAEGPCFNEDSYPEWGTGSETPDNTWWRTETFDLSPWAGEENVVVRFRLSSNGWTQRAGWFIDDIMIDTYHGSELSITPESLEVTLSKGSSTTEQIVLENVDDFPIAYTATVMNFADEMTVIHEEDFDVQPADWTIVNGGDTDTTWYWYDPTAYTWPNNLDGTPYMYVQRIWPDTASEELFSPVFDATGYATTYLEWDHHWGYGSNTDSCVVSVYDGNDWVDIFAYDPESNTSIGGWDNPVHEKFNITPYVNSNFQVRFYYYGVSWSRWAIDNFSVTGSDIPLDWLTLNNGTTVSGLLLEGESHTIDVEFTASEYAPSGVWYADVQIVSNDSAYPVFFVPCTMNISGPVIGTSPNSMIFDDTYVASSSMQTLVIANVGTETLEISDFVFSSTDFFTYNTPPISIEPGETHDMVIHFAPFELGLIEGTLELMSNDPSNPVHEVSLSGNSINDAINGWAYNYTGFNFILMDIAFPEGQDQVGYSVGQSFTYNGDGIVIKTTDSGESWEQVSSGTFPGLQGCSFVSMEVGYAVGWDGYMIKTTDGGETWEEMTVASGIFELTDVEFYDEDNGIVVGGAEAWVTDDGGETWTASTGLSHVGYGVTYADESTLFMACSDNFIYKSEDGGLSWTDVHSGMIGQLLLGVDFLNADYGMVVGDGGYVLQTADGGETWNEETIGDNLFHGVHIWNEDTAHIVGTPDLIYKTTDGGTTWNSQYEPYSAWKAYYKVVFTDNYTGFVCGGSNGIILRKEGLDLQPSIAVDPLVIAFDTTLVGEYSEAIITIENNGNADLDISSITSSSTAFTVEVTSLLLGPGMTEEVVVTFTPDEMMLYEGTLSLESNDPVTATVEVELSGYGNIITGVNAVSADRITVYPNPANDFIYLDNVNNAEVYLFNLAGELKIRERCTGINASRMNVSGLQSGTYVVKIVLDNGQTVVKKLEILR